MMVMFPLTFVSNIFVDPKTMPGWMQAVIEVNPITHLATVIRGLMHGSVPAGEIGWVLVSSVLLVAVFGPITMVLYRNKK
jgi:ABC-2 type transport system permease protein